MSAPVSPGDVLAGKYRVERVLGEGGVGVVVAARHLQLDQLVALKFLLPEAIKNPEARERFTREARFAARLKGEHVARIMDVGTLDAGAPYIVMEFLQGSDLATVLTRQGALSLTVAVDFILQACDAMAEAHALGIIHRDLKPQNLFVTRGHDNTNLIKVLDFGISKSIAGGDFSATNTQTMLGSPAYMSPEQMRSARLVDPRTDVWSLGIILYQLIFGHVPWDADSFTALCFKIAMDPLPPFPRPLQAGLEDVLQRCLEKDPDRRFADVYELALALRPFAPAHCLLLVERVGRVLRGQTGESAAITALVAVPITLPEAAGQRVTRTATASRGRLVALGAAIVVAIGLVVGAARLSAPHSDDVDDRRPPPPSDKPGPRAELPAPAAAIGTSAAAAIEPAPDASASAASGAPAVSAPAAASAPIADDASPPAASPPAPHPPARTTSTNLPDRERQRASSTPAPRPATLRAAAAKPTAARPTAAKPATPRPAPPKDPLSSPD